MGFIWPYISPWGLYKAFIEPYLGLFRAGVVRVVLGCLELVGAKTCNSWATLRPKCVPGGLEPMFSDDFNIFRGDFGGPELAFC